MKFTIMLSIDELNRMKKMIKKRTITSVDKSSCGIFEINADLEMFTGYGRNVGENKLIRI